ncbi:MAG: DNA-binding protein [Alphaproteobacteria bacterium]|nr:DNA-binding protein [Alphaproteobacteria bacterium]
MQLEIAQTPASPESGFLPARRVWERYGVTSMTLHRWVNDPAMKFPRPTYFGRFRFWRLNELEDWERRQPRGKAA